MKVVLIFFFLNNLNGPNDNVGMGLFVQGLFFVATAGPKVKEQATEKCSAQPL